MNSQNHQFRTDGFLYCPQLLSHTDVDVFRKAIHPIYREWLLTTGKKCEANCVNMSGLTHPKYFNNSDERVSFFKVLIENNIYSHLKELFNQEILFHNTQLFFNPKDPDKHPYWHRDLQFSSHSSSTQAESLRHLLSLHVRIPLLPELGIAIVPGSHKRWDTDEELAVRNSLHNTAVSLQNERRIFLEPGDVFIFHSESIHRGIYAGNDQRLSLDLCLGHPHPLTEDYFDAELSPTWQEYQKIPQPSWYRVPLF